MSTLHASGQELGEIGVRLTFVRLGQFLVSRHGDEPYSDWLNRIALQHSTAVQVEGEMYQDLGLDRQVQPGQPFPVITAEYAAAGEHVEVLEHQMNAVRAKLIERNGWSE